MLSVKQGGIKNDFLSLWYNSTRDWTPVSWAIGKQFTHYIYYVDAYMNLVFMKSFVVSTFLLMQIFILIFYSYLFFFSNFSGSSSYMEILWGGRHGAVTESHCLWHFRKPEKKIQRKNYLCILKYPTLLIILKLLICIFLLPFQWFLFWSGWCFSFTLNLTHSQHLTIRSRWPK